MHRKRGSSILKSLAITGLTGALFTIPLKSVGFSAENQHKSAKIVSTELNEVVVTATRTPIELKKLPDSVTVINQKDIDQRDVQGLYQVFETYPSISIKHNGWLGQWGYLRLRGGKNQDVAVLFNGIRIYDPTNPANDFGDLWSWIDADNIAKIEIVRGPQSALYGSNAMAGVIDIITPQGGGPFQVQAKGYYGSYNTWHGAMNVKGSLNDIGYYFGWAGTKAGGLYKHSKFRKNSLDVNLNVKPFNQHHNNILKTLKVDLNLRYTYGFLNYGQWDWVSFKAYDDPCAQRRQTLLISQLKFNTKPIPWWKSSLIFAYIFTRRSYWDPDNGILGYRPDGTAVTDSFGEGLYRGKVFPIVFQNDIYYGNNTIFTWGIEYYQELGKFYSNYGWGPKKYSGHVYTTSYFANIFQQLFDKKLAINIGARLDDHEEFGTHFTYKIGLAYFLPFNLKFKANLATGFRAPSLFNLYDPQYGNPDLNPEKSTGGDIGIEQSLWQDKLDWSLVWFNTHYKERISFNYSTWHYYNSGGANTTGLEFISNFRPLSWFSLSMNYTYTEGQEGDHERLALVPYHQVGIRAHFKYQLLTLNVYYKYVSRRPAYDFSHYMPDYSRVDLTANYKVNKHFDLFVRVENLFNVKYEWAAGYKAPRLSLLAGLKVKSF